MKKTSVRMAASLGVAAVLLGLLMAYSGVSPADVWGYLRTLSLEALALAVSFHLSIYVLRAYRFQLLIPPESRPPYWKLLVLSGAHNMASYVLPAKTGEASWMVYLKGYCGVRASIGIASLVVARLLDGAVLCSALAISCLWIGMSHKYDGITFLGYESTVFLKLAGGLLVALMLVFALLAARADLLIKLVTKASKFVKLHHWSVGEKFLANLYQAALALRDAGRGKRLGIAALVTVPVWLGIFGFYDRLSKGVRGDAAADFADLNFAETIFGSSMAVMANLLPVNGAAGAGTQEGGWVLGFGILGIDREHSLPVSLVAHSVQLIDVVVLGLLAHIVMGFMSRRLVGSVDEVDEELPAALELPPLD